MKDTPQFTVKLYLPPPETISPERVRRELEAFKPESCGIVLKTPNDVVILEPASPFKIGSAPECDLVIVSDYVSALHCEINRNANDQWQVTDKKSANGTWVNGKKVRKHVLSPTDVIQIGHSCLMVREVSC